MFTAPECNGCADRIVVVNDNALHAKIKTATYFILDIVVIIAVVSCVRNCLIYGSETCPMKVEHEAKLDRNEMSMLRWMCGFNLKDNKKNTEIRGCWDLIQSA